MLNKNRHILLTPYSVFNHSSNLIKITTFAAIAKTFMGKNLKYAFIGVMSLWLASCSNNLNIQAPYKNITVVYGLLDQSDSAHYIRVNRAFEGIGNAYTIAKIYDSVYYPTNQITVQLYDVNSNKTINLTPDSTIPLPPGTFSYPKQMLYKTTAPLNVTDVYNLIVTNEKTHQQTTGSTALLSDVNFTTNIAFQSTFPMLFSTTSNSTIQWTTNPNTRIYQMTLRFYYSETISSVKTEKYIDWIFGSQTTASLAGGANMTYAYNGIQFLNIVKAYIPVNDSAKRTADSIRMIFTSGSDDLNTYIQLSQPSLGINQDIPTFSDVKNGIGIYTARHIQTITKPVSVITNDSLIFNPETVPLNFH
jgi:hypothetical protein